jgi:hypothetical protein
MIEITGLQSLKTFGKQATAASKNLPNDINRIKIDSSIQTFGKLLRATRVDTTKAISNWTLRTPERQHVEREAYFPGKNRSTFPQSFALASRREPGNAMQAKPGMAIYISNDLDYVKNKLNPEDNYVQQGLRYAELRIQQNSKFLKYFF